MTTQYGSLVHRDNKDPGGSGVGNNCAVDANKKILFFCHEAGGTDTYLYSSSGILTHVDNHLRSGLSLGAAIDPTYQLLFIASSVHIGIQDPGGTVSYTYDESGNITYVDQHEVGVAKGIDIDTNHRIIFVAKSSSRGLDTYTYDTSGNLTLADNDNPGGNALGVCVDTINHIVFLCTDEGGVYTYTYDASGNLTSADNDDQGGGALGAVVDPALRLMFLSNADRGLDVYSYTTGGILTHLTQYDTPGLGNYGIDIDTDQRLLFFADDITGIKSFMYTVAGAVSLIDSDDQGGSAYGAAADTINHLVFLANWGRGVESYSYSYEYLSPRHEFAMRKLFPIDKLKEDPIFLENFKIIGKFLDILEDDGNVLLVDIFPDTSTDLLESYETTYNLTSSGTITERRNRIISAMRARGRLYETYFEAIGNKLGDGNYTVSIAEGTGSIGFMIHTYSPNTTPKGAATLLPGVLEDAPFDASPYKITVTVTGVASAPELETLYEKLKPAWTKWAYTYIP